MGPEEQRWGDVVARHPGLRLLLLVGSRAVGRDHEGSDWDFAVLADDATDLLALRADLVEAAGTDAVDLADLDRASAVLRRDAAAHGIVLSERQRDAFLDFAIEATTFWCDAETVFREAFADVRRAAAAGAAER